MKGYGQTRAMQSYGGGLGLAFGAVENEVSSGDVRGCVVVGTQQDQNLTTHLRIFQGGIGINKREASRQYFMSMKNTKSAEKN